MTRVAPTFYVDPTVTDTTVRNEWRIDGDTPLKVRIYLNPDQGLASPTTDIDPSTRTWNEWSGLSPGKNYTFWMACVYSDDVKFATFPAKTTGIPQTPGTPQGPNPPLLEPVTGLRATQQGFYVRLDYFLADSVVEYSIFRSVVHIGGERKIYGSGEPLSDHGWSHYIDHPPDIGTAYEYRVGSRQKDGSIVFSSPVQITLSDPKLMTIEEAVRREEERARDLRMHKVENAPASSHRIGNG
jgi:hypothetical protein